MPTAQSWQIIGGIVAFILSILSAAYALGKWAAKADTAHEVLRVTLKTLEDGFKTLTEELRGFREFTTDMRATQGEWGEWRKNTDVRIECHEDLLEEHAKHIVRLNTSAALAEAADRRHMARRSEDQG